MKKGRFVTFIGVAIGLVSIQGRAGPPPSRNITVDAGRSSFVVVTRRAGIAKSVAHDHLIEAKPTRIIARGVVGRIEGVEFQIRSESMKLTVDDPTSKSRLQGRLKELKILDEDFTDLADDDRAEIRKNMLSEDQLYARRYPYIEARILSSKSRDKPSHDALAANAYLTLDVTIRGRTRRYNDVPARIVWKGDVVHAETVLNPRFEDFGFEAYSAMLGAVRNRDDFYVYVNLVGKAKT
ncbi:MAG: YceI family protein, partial [Deltaproteobacteria bacterium]|nr:YceI family protein [Deltaproteobacteria bacterium]